MVDNGGVVCYDGVVKEQWTVTNFRGHDAAYACTVCLNGVKVIDVEQTGRGGCNTYHVRSGAPAGIRQRFTEMAEEWGKANKAPSLVEITDNWVLFRHDGKAMVWTAEQYLNMSLKDLL